MPPPGVPAPVARAWLLLALAALLAAPAVPAQPAPGVPLVKATLSVSVEDPGHALQPDRDEALVVLLSYNVQTGAVPAPGPDPTNPDNDTQHTRITLAAKTIPSWVENVTFDPPVVEVKPPTGSGNTPATAMAIVHVKRGAPALQREDFVITGSAEPNGNIQAASGESPAIKLRAAFIAKVNVTAPVQQIVPGGRWTDMPFTLTNLGNAETKVELNVTARPQDSQVEYPPSVTLPVNGTQVVNVRLRVPWTYGEGGIVELEATPLNDQDEGKPTKAEIEVLGQSATPTLGAPAALLALAALALLRRR